MPGRRWVLLLILAAAALPGCAAAPTELRWSVSLADSVYFLEFDNDGEPIDPSEFFRLRRSLEGGKIQHLMLLSLGWSYDRPSSLEAYRDLLLQYLTWLAGETGADYVRKLADGSTELVLPDGWAVACVVWSSKATGVTTFLSDLLPASTTVKVIGAIPDAILFPFTFWSKAGKANRISYSLVRHLNVIMDDLPVEPPNLYLVGHSFGCRVINTVVESARPGQNLGHLEFHHGDRVRAALYIQPAMTYVEIPRDTHMPVVVTQSRHDHANGILFPFGNIIGNTYGMESWLFLTDRFQRKDVDRSIQERFGQADEQAAEPTRWQKLREGAGDNLVTRVLAETGGMVFGILTSIPIAVFSWCRGQMYELYDRHLNYPMDTLAQIPLVEGPVEGFDRHVLSLVGWEQDWGIRHKGLFDFGPFVESAGRMDYPGTLPLRRLGDSRDNLAAHSTDFSYLQDSVTGVHFVRAEMVIRKGFSDYQTYISADATYGIIDVVGAHNDFKRPEVYRLIHAVMSL